MSTTIKGKQTWLTRQGTQLDDTIKRLEEFLETASQLSPREMLIQTRQGSKELEFRQTALEKALEQFTNAADVADLTGENLTKAESNISVAQELLFRAQNISLQLQLLMGTTDSHNTKAADDITARPQLPPLQISKFRGQLWEWDQFWGIFCATVHSRPISKIEKLHYLLGSLQGPAKEAVQDLQITEENYDIAVDLLQSRYGNEEAIVGRLLTTLQTLRPQSSSLQDQRRMLDKIMPLISQLQQKGESVETQHMKRAILGKFTDKIQRAVLKRKESSWTTADLLRNLQNYFATEDEIQYSRGFPNSFTHREATPKEQTRKTGLPSSPLHSFGEVPQPNSRKFPCFYCHRTDHTPVMCTQYPTHAQRINQMQQRNLCKNCGSTAHKTPDCNRGACRQCNKKGHHTSICRQLPQKDSKSSQQYTNVQNKTQAIASTPRRTVTTQNFAAVVAQQQSARCTLGSDVILRKADDTFATKGKVDLLIGRARIWNARTEEYEEVYVILDTGADQSFITANYANHLGLKPAGSMPLTIRTFGSDTPMEKECDTTFIKIEDQKGKLHQFNVAQIDFIAGDIQRAQLNDDDRDYLAKHDIQLSIRAQETVVVPQVLLGCGDLFEFFEKGLGHSYELPSGLKLLQSRIGYLVTGRNRNEPQQSTVRLHTVSTDSTQDAEKERTLWDQYWSLDSAGIEEFMGTQAQEQKDENQRIWNQFRATVERHDDGYYVRLPWKDTAEDLPDNRTIAYNRLRNVLTKLNHDPTLLLQYHEIFQDQLTKGIIEEVDEDAKPDGRVVHYLAHQAVITPHKDTTKLRIVFDGSDHHKNAPCLNDKLYQGPVILPSLIDILNRFRIGNIAIISDIEKAFLQVHLQKLDRDATRCLWIRNIDMPLSKMNIVTYRFTRVTFGLNCSPFLLGATIMEHLDQTTNRELAERIKNNVYVDNIIMTASTPQQAMEHCLQARQLFAEINMNLREFRTNSAEANRLLPEECLGKSSTPKVLGIQWDPNNDTLDLACRFPVKTVLSKRTISEQVAAIFDPMGWMTPLMLKPKLFLQQLWKHDYTWDQVLSDEHQQQWKTILNGAHNFETKLPRMTCNASRTTVPEMIVFTDASKNAMAACVYLLHEGNVNLLMAKSKLPSIKDNPTIPKLEMNALTMGTRLVNTIFNAVRIQIPINAITIFTDSEIALGWLRNPKLDQKAGTLVRNRTREIRRIAESLQENGLQVKFGYVITTNNPADVATRGLTKDEFKNHPLWWKGPDFLSWPRAEWPPQNALQPQVYEETPGQTIFTITSSAKPPTELIDWTRHSSMERAVASFAHALRWLERLTKRVNPDLRDRILERIPELRFHHEDDFITVPERERIFKLLLRNHQRVHIEGKINLQRDRLIPTKDSEGIIRCRGRLQKSHLPDDSKNPILIGKQSALASLLIRDAHATFHLGTAHTMTRVREKFWIPQLRRQVQKVIRRCVPCQRMNNLPYRYPQMSDLPARRVSRSRPFLHVGIDYFGPIATQSSTQDTTKAYGIILTCTVTRLLHLECVQDMSTEQLLNALRRFFARRGVPETITSDNAPYFLLADQILSDAASQIANDTIVAKVMATKGILWKTITPYAPWQGSFYERLIKSIKHALYKTLGKAVVPIDTLTTLLIEIEGTLNTRPLTYQEEHWEDQPIIRPIDFIQRDLIVTYPMEKVGESTEDPTYHPAAEVFQLQTRRQTEEALQTSHQFTEKFWKIWSEQYLTALRKQHVRYLPGNHGSPRQPEPGHVVLVADPNLPRNTWKMGRITKVNTNSEGIAREAELVMPNRRVTKRPINHLIPLELEDSYEPTTTEQSQTTESEEVPHTDEDYQPRYNLRKKERVNYDRLHHGTFLTLSLLTISALAAPAATATVRPPVRMGIDRSSGSLQCTPEGILLLTTAIQSYELCAEGYCLTRNQPPAQETIRLPPEISLHEHSISWKISNGNKVKTVETRCPASPFCSQVNCWFCTANILNPHCQPRSAIIALAVIIYCSIALLYTLCYVPMVIGLPCRIFFRLCHRLIWQIWKVLDTIRRKLRPPRRHLRRPSNNLGFVPLILIMCIITGAISCQDVDVFDHKTTVCSRTETHRQLCKVDIMEVVKLNTFSKEACLRLQYQRDFVKEVRIQWVQLRLQCQKQTLTFTRHALQKVLDAKRCAHAGSCVDEKCAGINTTALLPELHQANYFPGITYCVESCGGPGCGCFYMSSGCLFYRIYAQPLNDDIFEIFRCPQWKEEVIAKVEVTNATRNRMQKQIKLLPTIPHEIGNMKFKITSLTVPPTPALQSTFISDGRNTALRTDPEEPPLRCPSYEDARTLECDLHPNCRCQPAETTVNCLCTNNNLTSSFYELRNRLPVRRPWITFTENRIGHDNVSVTATISNFITAELLVTINEQFDTSIKEITDSICKIDNTDIIGCYHCTEGATAEISCTSPVETMATVACGDNTFSVPCDPQGAKSSLRFNVQYAQVHWNCESSCGATKTHFEITGILIWTKTFYGTAEKLLAGESNIYEEVKLPDFSHIYSVVWGWYKFSMTLVFILIIAVATGYIFLWSCGLRILVFIPRLVLRGCRRIFTACMHLLLASREHHANRARRHFYKEL